MSDTTPPQTKTTAQLRKELRTHANEIGKIRQRLNQLVDNIVVLENDLGAFKKNVSRDLLEVIDVMKENQKR